MASNITHPLLSVDTAVVVVAAAVGGGRVVAVACHGVKVSLGGFMCHAIGGLVRRVVGHGK